MDWLSVSKADQSLVDLNIVAGPSGGLRTFEGDTITSPSSWSFSGKISLYPPIQVQFSVQLYDILRSLATRGELVPIYQKAKEKAAEAEKRKKEKGKA